MMELEDIPEEEYKEYIERLRKRPLRELDYGELSDLASIELEDACEKQDWQKLKLGFRLLWLVTNKIEGKADATKTMLIKMVRGITMVKTLFKCEHCMAFYEDKGRAKRCAQKHGFKQTLVSKFVGQMERRIDRQNPEQ